MQRTGDNVLDMAMGGLFTQVKEDKRNAIFAANQRAIKTIKDSTSVGTIVSTLQFKPNINGDSDSQSSLPLTYDASFAVDLNSIELPSGCGINSGKSLKDVIKNVCDQFSIQINSKSAIEQAVCTPVMTAVPGRHDEKDQDCAGVTQAEFVPVYNSNGREKRVIVLCFTSNGVSGLRVDHLKVTSDMTCMNRVNSPTALSATEIPNLAAANLRNDFPEVFKKLKDNSCTIAFIEYDLEQPVYRSREFSGYNPFNDGAIEKSVGITRGVTRGGGEHNVYSVLGQGSHTQDNSQKVTETGIKKLSSVSVFVAGAYVVNTNNKEYGFQEANNVTQIMKMRAKDLGDTYKQYKVFKYQDLVDELNGHVRQFQITTSNTDIFENALFKAIKMESINPTKCHFAEDISAPGYIVLNLGMSYLTGKIFTENLQNFLGYNSCQFTNGNSSESCIRVSLAALARNMDKIEQAMDQILSDKHALTAYHRYNELQKPKFDNFINMVSSVAQNLQINPHKTNCVETVLLKMFGCNDNMLEKARVEKGEGYVGQMMDARFILDIPANQAKNLVDSINRQFTNSSNQFPLASLKILGEGFTCDTCEVVIDTEFLCSPAFQELFKKTFNNLLEDEPLLIEKFRLQSGTLSSSQSSECQAERLQSIAEKIQKKTESMDETLEHSSAKDSLVKNLVRFSSILTNSHHKASEAKAISHKVTQSIKAFESTQSQDELENFESHEAADVSSIQSTLGFRRR